MSAPGVVTVRQVSEHTAELTGKSVLRLLRKAGVPHQFNYRPLSQQRPCWSCPARMIGDLVAAAEVTRGVRVELVGEQGTLL